MSVAKGECIQLGNASWGRGGGKGWGGFSIGGFRGVYLRLCRFLYCAIC